MVELVCLVPMVTARLVPVSMAGREMFARIVSYLYYRLNDIEFTVTDNCDPNPCKENGTCTNMFNDYSCQCIFGLQGKDCSESMFSDITHK